MDLRFFNNVLNTVLLKLKLYVKLLFIQDDAVGPPVKEMEG